MTLTPRESDVLHLNSTELITARIAHRPGVSVATIETHRRHLLRKAGFGR